PSHHIVILLLGHFLRGLTLRNPFVKITRGADRRGDKERDLSGGWALICPWSELWTFRYPTSCSKSLRKEGLDREMFF
ncbi:hypothetical protein BDV41DRAFT_553641, partial [Aspergillus transmontanensis]